MWQQYLCYDRGYLTDIGHFLYLFDAVLQGLNSNHQKLEAISLRSSYEQRIEFLDQLCHQFLAGPWSYEVHWLKSDSLFLRELLEAGFVMFGFFKV